MATQFCPICSTAVPPNPRYPRYLCPSCIRKATSADGRLLEFEKGRKGERSKVRGRKAIYTTLLRDASVHRLFRLEGRLRLGAEEGLSGFAWFAPDFSYLSPICARFAPDFSSLRPTCARCA